MNFVQSYTGLVDTTWDMMVIAYEQFTNIFVLFIYFLERNSL